MFEFNCNVTSKVKCKQLGRIYKCLVVRFPGQKRVVLGKGSLLALVRDLNEIALTLLEKDLDTVVNENEEET